MIKTSRFVAALMLFFGGGLIAKEFPTTNSAGPNSVLHLVYTSSTVGYVDPCG